MRPADAASILTHAGWRSRSVALSDLHEGDLGIHDAAQRLVTLTWGDVEPARYAVVMPVHNQAPIIDAVLMELHTSSSLPHELCVVIDDCSDGTLDAVVRWLRQAEDEPLITRMTLVLPENALFETLCDVVGMALTSAPFVIEVQADMFVRDPAFDERLLAWFEVDERLLAVSGRGGHDLADRPRAVRAAKRAIALLCDRVPGEYSPSVLEHFISSEIGRTGHRISRPASLRRSDRLFLHETVMRGPLALRRLHYDHIGGFDPSKFFLGNDDHDLCERAGASGLTVGYTPVRFDSPLDAGSTRAPRTAEQKAVYTRFATYYRDQVDPRTENRATRTARGPRRVLRSPRRARATA